MRSARPDPVVTPLAAGFVLGCVLLAGCSESLFGAHKAGPGGDDDGGNVPDTCTSPCLADAAADFDGTLRGNGNHWRYLEDHRDRTWTAMTGDAMGMTGKDAANQITKCDLHPDAAACRALPGALLVSSAGGTSKADPAIELTVPENQVIQLSLHAYVPSGADQTIRLYRNSREDVLFTGIATADRTLSQAITLDALAGDRFLVAVTPTVPLGSGATRVGLELFAAGTKAVFPSDCQLAVPFDSASGNTTGDLCHQALFTEYIFLPPSPQMETPVDLGPGPLPAPNRAAVIVPTMFLEPPQQSRLDWSHDITVQFWVQLSTNPTSAAWLFSDLDPDLGGGVALSLRSEASGLKLDVATCIDATPNAVRLGTQTIAFPSDGSWQLIRVVRAGDTVDVCLNGRRVTSFPFASNLPPMFETSYPPSLGKLSGSGAMSAGFNGLIDDLRVITGALPCDPP